MCLTQVVLVLKVLMDVRHGTVRPGEDITEGAVSMTVEYPRL